MIELDDHIHLKYVHYDQLSFHSLIDNKISIVINGAKHQGQHRKLFYPSLSHAVVLNNLVLILYYKKVKVTAIIVFFARNNF